MVIWIIGLAGAGKTTVGRAIHERLKARNPATVFLDGDHLRAITEDLGHSIDERRKNGWRLCRLCHYLDEQDIDVVCCVLSLFREHQAWNRETYSDYFEVYLDVPMEVLEARDQKGLYSGARAGTVCDVVGIDIPFEPPAKPDLVIANGVPTTDFGPVAERILTAAAEQHPNWTAGQ